MFECTKLTYKFLPQKFLKKRKSVQTNAHLSISMIQQNGVLRDSFEVLCDITQERFEIKASGCQHFMWNLVLYMPATFKF